MQAGDWSAHSPESSGWIVLPARRWPLRTWFWYAWTDGNMLRGTAFSHYEATRRAIAASAKLPRDDSEGERMLDAMGVPPDHPVRA